MKTVPAEIDEEGRVTLLEKAWLPSKCRAWVTVLENEDVVETALLAEAALGRDWNRPEEEIAWSHLQSEQ